MSLNSVEIREAIENGRTSVGIELGSTRIKTVLIGPDNFPLAAGSHDWENSYVDNIWTYDLDEVWQGIQSSYSAMAENVLSEYGIKINRTGSIGISAMMHGYLVFDQNDELLVPFRTWRNNITEKASEELTELFNYPIPQRWGIAHLCQAISNGEEHIGEIRFMTTLAGYVHWKLTGEKVLGIGDASGMFPIDMNTKNYDRDLLDTFAAHTAKYNFPWEFADLLPKVLVAGENAGELTVEGAKLLDASGRLQAGIPLCPPEGDAGTGMVATNSVAARTGNVSAGTSVFAMIVLEKELSRAHSEIDLVTTPEGNLVAMVHSNNCTSDYDAWLSLFAEAVRELGFNVPKPVLYDTLLEMSLKGDSDCGGLLSYGYIAGEHITGFEEGRPLFVRTANSSFNLANFMRVNLFTSLGALKTGLKILLEEEKVQVDEIRGHGGFFKTREVGQKIMAAATNTPVSVMKTAGEGGAWGIALLASYMINKTVDETLTAYLQNKVFAGAESYIMQPDPRDVAGFNQFFQLYTKGLPVERAAVDNT